MIFTIPACYMLRYDSYQQMHVSYSLCNPTRLELFRFSSSACATIGLRGYGVNLAHNMNLNMQEQKITFVQDDLTLKIILGMAINSPFSVVFFTQTSMIDVFDTSDVSPVTTVSCISCCRCKTGRRDWRSSLTRMVHRSTSPHILVTITFEYVFLLSREYQGIDESGIK